MYGVQALWTMARERADVVIVATYATADPLS